MKTETIPHLSTIRLLAIVALTTGAFAAAANAESGFTGTFTVPYEVHWGKVVLAPGDYSITMESSAVPALIRSASGETKMFTNIPIRAASEKGGPSLVVTVRGNEHRVLSLNVPRLGVSLIYEPLTYTEREQLAKTGQIQALPVIIASARLSGPAKSH